MAPEQQSQHPLADEEVDYPLDADETLDPHPDVSDDAYEGPPPTLRLRVSAWDLICTFVLTGLLLYLATATAWPNRLFGFLKDVCVGETCGPVPFGVDMYIYPVAWGASVRRWPRPASGRSSLSCGAGTCPFGRCCRWLSWWSPRWPAAY